MTRHCTKKPVSLLCSTQRPSRPILAPFLYECCRVSSRRAVAIRQYSALAAQPEASQLSGKISHKASSRQPPRTRQEVVTKTPKERKILEVLEDSPRPTHQSAIQEPDSRKSDGQLAKFCSLFDSRLAEAEKVLSSELPSRQEVEHSLSICRGLAQSFSAPQNFSDSITSREHETKSDVLETKNSKEKRLPIQMSKDDIARRISEISNLAYRIVKLPQAFLTAKHLAIYVNTQKFLRRPETFPEVFDLFASKPVPITGSSPVKYKNARPNAYAAAVPLELATEALDVAIDARNLPLAISIVNTTVNTKAFRWAKFARKAMVPFGLFGCSPLAAYSLAGQATKIADPYDPEYFHMTTTMGIMAYITFTSMIGYIAITTSNDQMVRVTWLVGTPLRWRWMKEEERSLLDRIAMAWGFKERHRRGDEEGEDWQNLRTYVKSRGMVLDKPELMEGME